LTSRILFLALWAFKPAQQVAIARGAGPSDAARKIRLLVTFQFAWLSTSL